MGAYSLVRVPGLLGYQFSAPEANQSGAESGRASGACWSHGSGILAFVFPLHADRPVGIAIRPREGVVRGVGDFAYLARNCACNLGTLLPGTILERPCRTQSRSPTYPIGSLRLCS